MGGGGGANLIVRMIKRIDAILSKPIIKRERNLAQILLLQHILIPNDQLDDS